MPNACLFLHHFLQLFYSVWRFSICFLPHPVYKRFVIFSVSIKREVRVVRCIHVVCRQHGMNLVSIFVKHFLFTKENFFFFWQPLVFMASGQPAKSSGCYWINPSGPAALFMFRFAISPCSVIWKNENSFSSVCS